RPAGPRALRGAVGARESPILRRALRSVGRRARQGDCRRDGARRPRGSREGRGEDVQRWHEAAAESRCGPAARPGHPAPRRADGRRRSAEPQRDLRESHRAEKTGQGAALHDALHGGSRTPRRPHRHHRSRQGDRRRHARGAAEGRACQPGNRVPGADGKEPAGLMTPLLAMIRKDLQLFFSDRRSVIVSFAVPIAIASFFGSIFSGPSRSGEPAKITVMVVDQDGSTISKAIVAGATADRSLRLTPADADTERDSVRRGKTAVGIIIPKSFGEKAGAAFFGNGEKPELELVYDPSRSTELAMVRGIMTQHVMEAVSKEMFGGQQGRTYIAQALPEIEKSTMDPQQ